PAGSPQRSGRGACSWLPPSIQAESDRADQALGTGTDRAFRGTGQGLAIIGAVDHPFPIMRRNETVGRRREGGLDRLDDIRGDDDDELRLVVLIPVRAEQLAENRYVAEGWDL